MESGMKLRKARKAPKRFDDYAWEQEEEDRELSATITLPKARACSAIHTQPHTLPFNPNLPPAAFPTLEYSTSRKEASMAAGSPHAKSLVLNTKIQSHIEWLRNNKIKAERAESAKIPIPPPYTAPPDIQSDSMYDDLCRIKAQRETAEIIYHQNLAGSDIYARNMEILDRMARRTSDDWNIQEMTTSDEEESSPVISGQLKKVKHTCKGSKLISFANHVPVSADKHVDKHVDTHNHGFCCTLGQTLGGPPNRPGSYLVRDIRIHHCSDAKALP